MALGCQPAASEPPARFVRSVPWAESGIWLKADTHLHSKFSDGGVPLGVVVDRAAANGCQVVAVTDHADAELSATSDEYFVALEQARKAHPELILLAGLEWNVPPWQGREHATLLIPSELPERQILRDFQVLFDDWKRPGRDPDLARKAFTWLESKAGANSGSPVVIYNHPSRKRDDALTLVEEMSPWLASSAVPIGFEGGPGHQDSDPVGAYEQTLKTIDRWDPAAAEVGGAWDQLLARGYPVWGAVATSDFHNASPEARDDFWPGEFSETWLFAPDKTPAGALAALRAGTFFAAHGHIARQVHLRVAADGLQRAAIAGEAIRVSAGSTIVVTLELEIPARDWRGERNRIDEVELIVISPDEAVVAATLSPTGQVAMHVPLRATEGGLTVRARGRRSIPGAPDLMFYTNPIQILTDESDSSGASSVQVAAASGQRPSSTRSEARPFVRHLPGWLLLVFVLAGGLLVALADRWQVEVHRRFFSAATKAGSTRDNLPRAWRRYFVVALLGFVFLAVYGSFVPLQAVALDLQVAIARFQAVLQAPLDFTSRTDWSTNVLLFVPIGFFATGLLFGGEPSDRRRVLGVLLVVGGCAALSLLIEFGQLWMAERTCSQNDIVAESLGGLLGTTGWLLCGPSVIAWMSRFLAASRPRERVERLLELYLVVVVGYMLMPLDLTLRPTEVWDKWQAGKINFIPLRDIAANPEGAIGLLGDTLLLVPLGMLVALWRWPLWHDVRPLRRSLLAGACLVAAIEAGQLLVHSRYSSVTDLITGLFGVLTGWFMARWLVRQNAAAAERSLAARAVLAPLWLAILAYAVILVGVFCLPLDRWASEIEARERMAGLLTRPPLVAMYAGSELNAVSEMLRKVLLFAPLGGLLALAACSRRSSTLVRSGRMLGAWLLALALAAGIEFVQVWMPPHVPDVTDILLGSLGAAAGLLATAHVLASSGRPANASTARAVA